MSEWDSLQEDSGLVGCEALLYQEIAQLNEALAGTEDEISSFYRFGECRLLRFRPGMVPLVAFFCERLWCGCFNPMAKFSGLLSGH